MRFRSSVAFWIVLSAFAAAAAAAPQQAPAPEPDTTYGAPLSDRAALPLARLLDRADRLAGTEVTVEGRVEAVCQNMGCWMTLTDGKRQVRVTFKDYGFFVAKNLSGSRVRAEGVFDVREISVEEARHYLEDAGRPEEAAAVTEPQQGFVLVATGVRVLGE